MRAFTSCRPLHQILVGVSNQDVRRAEHAASMTEMRISHTISIGILKKKDYLQNLCVDVRIILKLILKI
jgi:hypothetical protein